MILHAKFLACAKEVFTNDKGEDVVYYRLHVWLSETNEPLKLPIRTDIAEHKLEDVKFGDEIEVPVGFRTNSKTQQKELAVIEWN